MKLKELEKRLKQEPENLGLRVQAAGLMREAGRSVEAVELYRSVALAYRDQGRHQQAIAVCRSILDIAPDDAACKGLLAMLRDRNSSPSRPPTEPSVVVRPSTIPPEKVEVPSLQQPAPDPRRSTFDATPLPKPLPYHLADPTTRPNKLSSGDLDLPASEGADTRPGDEERRETAGLAQAARRISGLISDSRGVPQELDLAAEVETRQRRRVDSVSPTTPIEIIDDEDLITSAEDSEPATERHDRFTPPSKPTPSPLPPVPRVTKPHRVVAIPPLAPRDSDDEVTSPRKRSNGDDET